MAAESRKLKVKNEWVLNGRGPYMYVLQPTGLERQVLRMKTHNNL